MIRAFSWNSHLSEQRLFECYLAERTGEGVDPRAAEHMADCSRCHDQYISIVGTMDDAWMAADRETSAVFPPEFLKNQQEQIARRLELVEHPGRIISFPALSEAATAQAKPAFGTALSRMAAGWVAAAAAAGLFVGAGAGFLVENRMHGQSVPPAVVSAPPVAPVGPAGNDANAAPATARVDPAPEPELDDDSRLMFDMEAAHDGPRTQELLAFDTLTPHIREITYRVR